MWQDSEDPYDSLVFRLWKQILVSINEVTESHRRFGYELFKELAEPSIEQILEGLGNVEVLIAIFLNSTEIIESAERTMHLYTCQKCVHLIRRTGAALDAANETEYQDCLQKLQAQRNY